MWRATSLQEGVLASLIAALLLAAGGLTTREVFDPGSAWTLPAILFALAFVIVFSAYLIWRRRLFRFVPYMSRDALAERIQSAKSQIWSFQISGGGFTTNSIDVYDSWLRQDDSRRLRLLFANPDNAGLLKSIVALSGLGTRTSEQAEIDHLRATILTTIKKYEALRSRLPMQVEVRVYDCCPPCSIHAVDVSAPERRGSFFVENYLPDLPRDERPCLLVRPHHSLFPLYCSQAVAWFQQSHTYSDRPH